MKFKINDYDVTIKYGFRPLMAYEEQNHKSFEPTGLTDIVNFFYACVIACNKGLAITKDDFIDYLDDNPQLLTEFANYLSMQYLRQSEIADTSAPKEKTKTKEVKKKKC